MLGQFIELLARPGCSARRDQRLHVALETQRCARRLEILGYVPQLHSESQVRLVRAVAPQGVLIFHVAKRPLDFDANERTHALHHRLDRVEHILLPGKRHLKVQLRKFQLPVGAKILVTDAFADLEVAVHAADHQYLLENLRRLRQRVELAMVNAAWHQAVARAFRS